VNCQNGDAAALSSFTALALLFRFSAVLMLTLTGIAAVLAS
jgi:hypothetical protein